MIAGKTRPGVPFGGRECENHFVETPGRDLSKVDALCERLNYGPILQIAADASP